METIRHKEQMHVLIDSLKAYWGNSRRYFLGGDMFLHFELDGKKQFRGPDFFIVMDTDDRERKSWVVWQEGYRYPDVIIELLSETTRNVDYIEKKELYEKVFETKEYYLYDPESQEFFGYRLEHGRYVGLMPDYENKIYCSTAGLYLTIRDNWLRWMTEDGYIVPTPMELYETEKQIADEAIALLKQAEQRADHAEFDKYQAEQKAKQAEQKAKQAEQKAKQAEQKARQIEEMLAEYRHRFGQL
jgi:Uma2 family endonuclease